ncbi:MAG: OmpA family protein [Myxococcota bacterium]
MISALALLGPAHAQSLDTQGPDPLPLPETFGQPVRVLASETPVKGAWSLALGLRGAGPSLTEYIDDGSATLSTRELVGPAFDLSVGGSWSPTHRVVVTAAIPARLAAGGDEGGGGLGDVRIGGGFALLSRVDSPVSVRLTPWVRLPTGSRARHLGAGGPRLGASLSAGSRLGPVEATLEAGADWRPDGLLEGGPGLRSGLGAHVPIGEHLSVGAEAALWGTLTSTGQGLASEAHVVVGGKLGRVSARATGGPAVLGRRAGTALASGTLAVVYEGGSNTPPEVRPEQVVLHVRDPSGRTVRGAEVLDGDTVLGHTDADGALTLDRPVWSGDLTIRASGLEAVALPSRFPGGELDVDLPFAPTPIRLRITDPLGRPVDVQAHLKRTDGSEEAPLEVEAPFFLGALEPGEWILSVEADGKGGQERLVTVGERRVRPLYIEVILLEEEGDGTLAMEVVDAAGRKVEAARVQLNGIPIGTTGSAGALWVHGLEGESRSATVRSEDYAESVIDIDLKAERDAVPEVVDVDYLPGTVRVIATGPDGPISDGLVVINGPTALPPMPLGEDGERLVVLDPGAWVVSLSSVTLGIQERSVDITPDSPNPLVAQFVLQPDAAGEVDLVVRVQDRNGTPVEGASIALDGHALGETSTGGTLRLRGIVDGEHRFAIEHPAIQPMAGTLRSSAGVEEHLAIVSWRPDVARVTATAAGLPVDALVVLSGAAEIGPEPLGARGQRYFRDLASGTWEVTASSVEFGIQTRAVQVSDPAAGLPEAVIRYAGNEGGSGILRVEVSGPDRAPVVGAPVILDGLPMGSTGSDGSVVIQQLASGPRDVQACAAPYVEARATATLRNARETRLQLTCTWDVGATRLVVTNGGAPAADTLVWLSGPVDVPPLALDAKGEQLVALAPGSWTATLSHPDAGIVERPFEVSAKPGLTTLETDLQGTAGGPTLLVRVRTPRGRPVGGATIRVDGAERATTNEAGVAVVRDVEPGARVSLLVEAPNHHPDVPHELELGPDRTEKLVELEPLPAVLSLSITDRDGTPLDATVDFVGAERLPGVAVAKGSASIELPPGDWTVFARAQGWAAQAREVHITDAPAALSFSLQPARVRRVGNELRADDIQFATGESAIRADYDTLLQEVAALMLAEADIIRIEAQGHTDSVGSVAANMELSQARAEEVRAALVDLGVPQSRVVARGFGPTHPVADNESDAGRAQNRRVAFIIVEDAPAR